MILQFARISPQLKVIVASRFQVRPPEDVLRGHCIADVLEFPAHGDRRARRLRTPFPPVPPGGRFPLRVASTSRRAVNGGGAGAQAVEGLATAESSEVSWALGMGCGLCLKYSVLSQCQVVMPAQNSDKRPGNDVTVEGLFIRL